MMYQCSCHLFTHCLVGCWYVLFTDAQRALLLMEEYKTKLGQTEDRQLRQSLERLINIFQSNLFQALIGMIPLHSNPGLICPQSLSNQSTSSTFPLYCHLPNLLEQRKQVFLFLPGTCLSPTRSTLISTCWSWSVLPSKEDSHLIPTEWSL